MNEPAGSYECLAEYYDWVMSHVDYQEWAEYLQEVFFTHNVQLNSVLELGCGTGRLAQEFSWPKESIHIHTDLSFAMLKNFPENLGNHSLADMQALPFKAEVFSLAFLTYDTFNYLLEKTSVYRFFKEAARVLKPNAHLFFDMTTEFNSQTWFYDDVDYFSSTELDIIRESRYDEETREQSNVFTFFNKDEDGRYIRSQESHRQRIYYLDEVKQWLCDCGFEPIAFYEGFTRQVPNEESDRIQILAKRI